jgi:hypothetical protein
VHLVDPRHTIDASYRCSSCYARAFVRWRPSVNSTNILREACPTLYTTPSRTHPI